MGRVVTVFYHTTDVSVEADLVPYDIIGFFYHVQLAQTALIIRNIFLRVSQVFLGPAKFVYVLQVVRALLLGLRSRKNLLGVVIFGRIPLRAFLFRVLVCLVPLARELLLLFFLVVLEAIFPSKVPLLLLPFRLQGHHLLAAVFFKL